LFNSTALFIAYMSRSGRAGLTFFCNIVPTTEPFPQMNFKISDKTVFAWHSWLGLLVGLFTLFLSITGTMLLFTDEIDATTAPQLVKVQPTVQRFPLDSMLTTFQRTYPQGVLRGSFLYNDGSNRAVLTEIMLNGEREWVYWNPHTNILNGSRKRDDILMVKVLSLHEELASGEWAHFLLFVVGLSLLASVLTGLWYYRKFLFNVYKVGIRRKNAYLFYADLHKWVGVTACLFLLMMGGTGTFFHWEKIERMLGAEKNKQPVAATTPNPPKAIEVTYSLDKIVAAASQATPNFTAQYIGYQADTNGPMIVAGTRPESVRLLGRFNTTAMIDAQTATVTRVSHKEDGGAEQRVEKSLEQLHYGQYGGVLVKILYAFGGFSLTLLSMTGFLIWLKKRK
jgi:uncharacterized iron-regulated membrane protein